MFSESFCVFYFYGEIDRVLYLLMILKLNFSSIKYEYASSSISFLFLRHIKYECQFFCFISVLRKTATTKILYK